VVDPAGIKGAGPPDQAVDFISLCEQQFGQVGSILTGDPCNQCFIHIYSTSP